VEETKTVTGKVEMVTPLSIDRAAFGLDALDDDDEPADACARQAPCKDCVNWVDPSVGCYAVDLPENWRSVEPFKSQACATEGCTCWGGVDKECEDCWLSLK
jgi:hypothetical protein